MGDKEVRGKMQKRTSGRVGSGRPPERLLGFVVDNHSAELEGEEYLPSWGEPRGLDAWKGLLTPEEGDHN